MRENSLRQLELDDCKRVMYEREQFKIARPLIVNQWGGRRGYTKKEEISRIPSNC